MYLTLQVQSMLHTLFPFPSFFESFLKVAFIWIVTISVEFWKDTKIDVKSTKSTVKTRILIHLLYCIVVGTESSIRSRQQKMARMWMLIMEYLKIRKKIVIVIRKIEFHFYFFLQWTKKRLNYDSSIILVKREWSLGSFSLSLV